MREDNHLALLREFDQPLNDILFVVLIKRRNRVIENEGCVLSLQAHIREKRRKSHDSLFPFT